MDFYPRFVFPWALLLLLAIPWSIWVGIRIRSLSRGRKWTAIVLRSIILLLVVLALAGAEIVLKTDKLVVFFVVDDSNSIPLQARSAVLNWINEVCAEHMTRRDQAGMIVFGEEASIELGAGETLELDKLQSQVGTEQTDLAAAIRLSLAAYPQGTMKRMVLCTDGNETRGSALEEIKMAQSSGVGVDIVPIAIGGDNEVRIADLSLPNQVNADEPFEARIVVRSEQDCTGRLRIFRRLRSGMQPLVTREVNLQKGDNTFAITQQLTSGGFYEYEATIESDADTITANNVGRAFTVIRGEPSILYVEADPRNSTYLAPALRREGIKVDQKAIGEMPPSIAQMQNYDAIVLSNVSSTDLTGEQLNGIEALVRDFGVGLIMIGGPDAFGAGGYHGTAVERTLPVNMDLKQRKVLPRGALVLIMHTCEIPQGNAWARDIGLASLNVLASQDLMGALAYGWQQGDYWIYELQPVGDKSFMRDRIRRASSTIGDMPSMGPTIGKAYESLRKADAAVKRVVLISDGDPAMPTMQMLNALKKEKIAVSTVCIAPHSPSDQGSLQKIAQVTGGNYYYVTNPNRLPQIFTKEAAVVKRGLLIEKEFTPKYKYESEILQGFESNGLPPLRGYVATSPKETSTIALVSHEDDPVLAHWRFGLGKSVAFTSDVTSRWATDWLAWDEFDRFWSQTVRWAVRQIAETDFRVTTDVRDGRGYVRIDAVDSEGNFVNFLRPTGIVSGPAPEFERQVLDLSQTGPGIYEGTFDMDSSGVYMVNLLYENPDGSQGMIPTGLALSYSREYEYNTTNYPLLEQLQSIGGGKNLDAGDHPFRHDLETAPTVTPIWHILTIIAVCLFPLEIFVRRVLLDWVGIYAGVVNRIRKLPLMGSVLKPVETGPVIVTGYYSTGTAHQRDVSDQAEEQPGGFGIRRPATTAPSAERAEAGAGMKEEAKQEYTQRLLAAKKRAQDRQRKRKTDSKDEEK